MTAPRASGTAAAPQRTPPRIEAMGAVDELNSSVGLVLAVPDLPAPVIGLLHEVQHDLFDLGGELSIPGHTILGPAHITRLEEALDGFNDPLPPLREFILPSGGPATAACHLARAIARRAERRVWTLVSRRTGHGAGSPAAVPEPAVGSAVRAGAGAGAPRARQRSAMAARPGPRLRRRRSRSRGQSNFVPGSSLRPGAMSLWPTMRLAVQRGIGCEQRPDQRGERAVLRILEGRAHPCPRARCRWKSHCRPPRPWYCRHARRARPARRRARTAAACRRGG